MNWNALDTWELAQLWSIVVPLLILASMSVTLLVLSPWGISLPASALAHFFTIWPLLLLALITYIARVKLGEEETEVPHS